MSKIVKKNVQCPTLNVQDCKKNVQCPTLNVQDEFNRFIGGKKFCRNTEKLGGFAGFVKHFHEKNLLCLRGEIYADKRQPLKNYEDLGYNKNVIEKFCD